MCSDGRLKAGVVLEGFLRFLETTQDFPSMMGVLLFSYNVSRGIHSGLNSSVTGFCFDSKLGNVVKTFIYLFIFLSQRRKIGDLRKKIVLQRHWKLCAKIPPYVHYKSPRQTGCLETTQRNL